MNEPARAPAHAAPVEPSRGVSRRGLLLGAAGVVLAAGGGVAVGALQPVSRNKPTGRPPSELVVALDGERALIAAIDATTGGVASVRTALRQIRADHVAHRVVLQAAVDAYPQSPAASTSASGPAQALDVAGLRRAERLASARASTLATRLAGKNATLLASIAACEASHAELFA
ncbi:MAG: hypothetical protein DLM58_18745 [Pseudonocardiales bacterium]|nr:MAG: hypothetical protein DLM58_18745 [Pseudonocardiales bacterium]